MFLPRRDFLRLGCGALASAPLSLRAANPPSGGLEREVGVTTGSFAPQARSDPGQFQMPGLLRIVRDELDMRVVDVFTPSLTSFDPGYLDGVRSTAEKVGCVLTNLKMNQAGLDLASRDLALREKSLVAYERSIDAAKRLGMRWARPLAGKEQPDMDLLVSGYRRLADYGAERGVQLLVENVGWLQADSQSVVKLVDAIGHNVAASPDTGNWASNAMRYEGLATTFRRALTCDFKALALGPGGAHEAYDLKRCFTIGWDTGFRGPWCIEHAHPDAKTSLAELRTLRDRLRAWIAERS